MMQTFYETVTDIHTVTQKHSFIALPVYTVYSSSKSGTSTSSTSSSSSDTPTMTSTIPTPGPPQPFSSGTPPELPSGMWTIPPVLVTPDIPQLATQFATQFPDAAIPSPSSLQPGIDASATSGPPIRTSPQPAYTLSTHSGSFNSTTSPAPTYTYGTSQTPSRSIVTVTSFLTPTTLLPSSGVSAVQRLGPQAVMFLAGLWVLIYVV
ncbi:hypothetical protein DL95DRAFT_395459 [Leptodontidium sp. 2 PMI_412]|nr:hypothetical protein DL95DRAFT_395459 [Leptodontidium sp. 2 PMI_412]